MTTPLINYSLASASRQIHAHADIYTRRRKQSVAHKSGRQFFETDVRGIGTSLQDDAEDGYNLNGRVILNFGKEFYELSFLRAKTSVARVLRTL
ncbi:Avra10-like protein [Blumeria hordei DH14]|uniref:Avra10-like protein n=1 Tax=Blumeria graminis f. sp. hordei (strain DH14) TaxID=546991 RepID=N1JJR6_BLUG1|nr:Avra10-like protein [Blumeria hordei DH14]